MNENIHCPVCRTDIPVSIRQGDPDENGWEPTVKEAIINFHLKCPIKNETIVPGADGSHQYAFHIQVYDSPDGDTWIRGVAEWKGAHWPLKILEMKTENDQ